MDVFLLLILFLLSLASALCDAEDDFFRSRERYLQPLYTLPQHAPVTGLKFDYFPPHNPTRALIVATTPTRRMPVHSLYLDVFQKIHSLGFNAVSFYTFWGLHEPKRGAGLDFSGFRNVTPLVEAAQAAGFYLVARPGSYINAETTAGGFRGWGTTDPAIWRTRSTTYDAAWQDYVAGISKLLAPYQITLGGPIILWQSENEYSGWQAPYSEDFMYEEELLTAWRANGIVVPTTHNDASPSGHYTSVNIWDYDSYPSGFDCSHP